MTLTNTIPFLILFSFVYSLAEAIGFYRFLNVVLFGAILGLLFAGLSLVICCPSMVALCGVSGVFLAVLTCPDPQVRATVNRCISEVARS